MKLTQAQQMILISINEYIIENNQSPTVRDIASDLNKGVATIHYHLQKLKQAKLIEFDKNGRIVAICQKQ